MKHKRHIPSGESKVRKCNVGERVTARILNCWEFGTVTKRLGSRFYIIKLDSGRELKKHIDQLRTTQVPEKKKLVSFGPTQSLNVPRWPCPQEKGRIDPSLPQNLPPSRVEPSRPQNSLPSQRPQRSRRAPDFLNYRKKGG